MADREELNPFTGLPTTEKEEINPFTGKPVTPSKSRRPALTSPDFMNLRGTPSSYQKYGVPVLPGLDIDEMRAQRQSRAEKWGRGLMKAGVTMAGAVAENTVGIMDGIGEAIAQGDWTKLYDNETGRAIDSMNAWMQENYPNYYTKKEQEAIGLENLQYANFWADKAANGLGYAVASIGTMWVTGGTGLLARGAGLAAKGAKAASKGLGLYNGAKAIATGTKIGQRINAGARSGAALNAAKVAEVGISMSHAEASVEAREMLNHAYDSALLDMAESRGVSVQELTAAEKQEARETASRIGNFGYATNLAVLAPTNLWMFGKGLFPKYGKMRPKAKGYRQDKAGKWMDMWAKENSPMWKRTASRYLKNPTENAISETFQEGTQYAIQKAGEGLVEQGGPSGVMDWIGAVGEGWGDTVSEKEGIESLMLGFIIGGFMGGAGALHERGLTGKKQAETDKKRARIINALNSEQVYSLAEKGKALKDQEKIAQRMQKALEDGDHRAYRDAQFQLTLSQIMMHEGAGTLDMYLEKLEDAKHMEAAEFAKAFGIPEGVDFDQVRIVNDLVKDVNKFVEMRDKVELMFPSRERTGLPAILASKEKTEEEKEIAKEEQIYKNQLIVAGLRLGDIDSRIEKMTADLNELFTPLDENERAEAERLIKRLQYNSSKIRRLEKKKRNSPNQELSDEDQKTLNGLYAELEQAKVKLEAETVDPRELEADKQEYKKRILENEDPEARITYLEEETTKRLGNLVRSISDPIKRVEAIQLYYDLVGLASSRTNTSFALEELLSDPEERAAYVLREKAKQQQEIQDEIDKYVEEQIEATNTADDLKATAAVAKERGISAAAREKLQKEFDNRKETEAVIHQRLLEEDVSALKVRVAALEDKEGRGEELTADEKINLHVLNKHIAHREEEGTLKGNRTLRKEKKAEAEPPSEAPTTDPKPKQEEDSSNAAPTTTNPDYDGDPRAPRTKSGRLQVQNGELAMDDKKTVRFDDNGFPIEGNDKSREFKIDREYLKTQEGHDAALNSEVEFVLNNETFEKDGKMVTEPVIYVKLGDRYIGILPAPLGSNANTQSNSIYMSLLEGNPVTGRISEIGYGGYGNYINEIKDGVPVLKPMSEVFEGGRPEGVIAYGFVREEGVEIIGDETLSEEEIAKAGEAVSIRKDKKVAGGERTLGNGQMVMIFRFPNGDYAAIPMSTVETGEAGLAAIRGHILETPAGEVESRVNSIAGLPIWQRGFSKFGVEVTEGGVPLFSFYHKDKVVRLSLIEMQNLLQDKPVGLFQIGSLVSTEKDGDPVVEFQVDETAQTSDYIALREGMRQSFEEAVKATRRQVNGGMFASEESYTDPVSKKTYNSYSEFVETALLSTDVRFHKGLPTFDHQIKLDVTQQDNSAQEAADQAVVKPQEGPKKENKATPEKPVVGSGVSHAFEEENLGAEPTEEELAALEQELDVTDDAPDSEELERRSQEGPKPYIDLETGEVTEGLSAQDLDAINIKFSQEIEGSYEMLEMMFADGRTSEAVAIQAEIDELKAEYKRLTGKDYGTAFRLASPAQQKINKENAIAWLRERFGDDAVVIYNQLRMVGDNVVHGYMENGAVHLFSQAEVGTEYHEAFHLFFRTLLTQEQRFELYRDAAAMFGEPTAEDIAKARRGQPSMTDAEARILALEERMAEEFRDYVLTEQKPKGLLKRIAKFFKDLLVYIKALAGYPMTVRGAFSMIESNRIPKSYARTAQTFSPGGTAFRMSEFAADPKLGQELRDLVVYKVIKAVDANPEVEVQDLLGSPATANVAGGESVIRDWFLRSAFNVKGGLGTRALNDREFKIIKKAYDNPQMLIKAMSVMNVNLGAPDLTSTNEIMPDQMTVGENAKAHSKLFLEVYENWHDRRSELGGVEVRGYRADARDRLREFGIKTYDVEISEELKNTEDNDEGADRVYSVSRSKEDPAKTLGDKARRALSRIPVQNLEATRLGFQTFVPIEDVYKEIAASVVDSTDWVGMLESLKQKSSEITSLQQVYDFMVGLEARERALMYSVFAQSMTPYKLIKVEFNEDTGERLVKIINSSENSIQRYFAQKWMDESTSPRGLYTLTSDAEGNTLDLRIDEARRQRAENLYNKLTKANKDGVEQYRLLGELFLELGINIASTKEEAARRVKVAFNPQDGPKVLMYNFLTKDTSISRMFKPGGKLTKKDSNVYTNIFETEGSTMNAISNMIMSKFEAPQATSFFNGTGSLVYPINLKNDLNITTELVKSEKEDNLALLLRGKDNETGVVGSVVKGAKGDTRSMAYMLISNKAGKQVFEFVDIDSLKMDEDSAKEFEDFSYQDGFSVDLAMFAQSKEVRYIAIDTQGDRSKLSYFAVPNFRDPDTAAKYGFDVGSKTDPIDAAIERTYLLDLYRMHVAKKAERESPIVTYHDFETADGEIIPGKYREFQLGGDPMTADSDLLVDAYTHLENGVPMSPELKKAMQKYVSDTRNRMRGYRDNIIAELGGEQAMKNVIAKSIKAGTRNNYGGYIKGEEQAYLDEFVEMSVLGRMMSRELLRSGVNYVKDGADYVKRSALSSTPGTQLYTLEMNNDPNNPDYGMFNEFREITLNDIESSLSEVDRADLKAKLVDQVGEAAAEGIISAYDRSNGTDAQAIISVDMYRRLRMGLGQWTATDEEVYNEYKAAPVGERKWDGARSPIMPLKPSYEYRVEHVMGDHRHLLPVSHKNSYVVLTDELAGGIPNLQNLAQFFENNNVHVANTISAKKLASFQPVDITDLSNAVVQTVPSRGLKFPQILPDKKAQKITFGRQPRKNMIANINPSDKYYLEDMGMEVSGRDLINMYQKAVIAKLNKGHDKVLAELGYDKVLEAREKGDKNGEAKAMQAMLPKLREVLTELGIERDLPNNIMASLNVIADANGVITTQVPMPFPTIQNKLDSLVMGMFRRNAYLQKLTGLEMVQFAEFGAHERDGSLKFYSIEEATDSTGKTYSKVAAAEVDIRRDVLEAMGVNPDASISEIEESVNKMLGYRIPQQGKSSMLMMKIRKVLPNSHSKAVRIPPAVTTMMGSDFDIDKMFVIFPEVEVTGKKQVKVTKVKPDYNTLKTATQEQFEELDEKVLNNIVFDTFMAIGSDVKHIHETMTPLDMAEEVDPLLQGLVGIGKPMSVSIDINDPSARLRSSADNMLSMSLRGIYANAIAGRNVALTAMNMGEFAFEGPQFKVDGVTVGNLTEKSPFPDPLGVNRFTDYYMSQYLSKAVDSVKNPIQGLMNDNNLTAPLTSYMLSIGMTPQQAIAFLNVPAVRDVVDQAIMDGSTLKRKLVGAESVSMDLNLADMQAIIKGEVKEYDKQAYVDMLAFMNEQAKQLSNLYRVISPDNIDQSGTTPQHLAAVERATNSTEKADRIVFGGLDALNNIVKGEAYPIVKAYYAAINKSIEMTTALGFIGTQESVVAFKEDLKELAELDFLNDIQHRDINRAILHHLVTKPGSPIFESGLLDADYIRERFVLGGAASVMSKVIEAAGDSVNPVLDAFTIETDEVNGYVFTYLKIDKTKLQTKTQKDMFTYTLKGMMDNPSLYGEEYKNEVRDVIRMIITNSIITTGFAPGMKSYFELIPVEFWRDLGVTEHLNQEILNLNKKNALADFKTEFLMSYGTHSARKQTLFPRDKGVASQAFAIAGSEIQTMQIRASENSAAFKVKVVGKKKILYQRSDHNPTNDTYMYTPTASKGKQYVFYETHLRDKTTGGKVEGSLFDTAETRMFPTPSKPKDKVIISSQRVGTSERETPLGAQEKIARLRENFSKAGIDVKVVEATLPPGTKGQVQGDTVYVDPAQMETDTVYHEFAHILIDMLPEDQVDRFIKQVIEADPALAQSVTAAYPELEGRELGKEILVTAIGLQGAKIERKNPSKLRILINKILRAIGKVFGVSPNAAAVLAEQMFVGDMKAGGLSGQFNPKLQRSKNLQKKMETVYEQVRDSLARQRFRLNQLAASEARDAKIRELDGLIQNIDELRAKADSKIEDLNEFYDFYEYVVGRTEMLRNMMQDLLDEVESGVPLSREEMFKRLNKIDSIRQTLESLYTEDESTSTVVQMASLLRAIRNEGQLDEMGDEVKELLSDLSESLEQLRELNEMYMDTVVPLTTNALLSYASPEAAAVIEAEKKRIKDNNDLSGFRPMKFGISRAMRIPEFKALNAEYFNSKGTPNPMSREEFDEKAMEIKLRYIENKMVGAAQITQELTEAQKSKSKFSYWLDPIVYSRQQNLQLFALAVKDALYKANEDTISFTYDLEPKYTAFQEWKGVSEFDQAKLNEDILTTVTVRAGSEKIKALSLVQQFDVDKYYSDYYDFLDEIAKKYNKPDSKATKEDWVSWYKSEDGANHKKAKEDWYAANTDPVEGAEQKYKSVINEQKAIEDRMKMLEVEGNPKNREELVILRSDYYKLEARKKKMGYYSPVLVDGEVKFIAMGELAQPKKKKYESDKYKKIIATPELKEYYDFIVSEYHKAQAKIGDTQQQVNSWDKYSYVMPTIRKDGMGSLVEDGWKELVKEKGRDFHRLDTDTEFGLMTEVDGQEIRGIPKYYTKPADQKNVSRDVAASITQFIHMANNYQQKSAIAGLVHSMLVIHEKKGVIKHQAGLPIRDQIAAMSRRANDLVVSRDEADNNDLKHLRDFVESVFYGVRDTSADIGSISQSKLAGKLTGATAVVGLAGNLLQVGNQAILDNLMTAQEAYAKQFFSAKDWGRAVATYTEEAAAIADLGAFTPKTKLGKAMQMFDALNEVTDSIGQNIGSSKIRKMLHKDSAFMLQHGVEHETAGVRMLAVLKSTKVKDKNGKAILNEDGTEADLWDMLVEKKNGQLTIDPRVANVNKSQVIAKIHGIAKRTNQVKGSFDAAMAQRTSAGKFLLLFRNYFIPGLRRRFGHGDMYQVDHELGQVTKGYYQTFANSVRTLIETRKLSYDSMSELDKQNLRRIAIDVLTVAGTWILYSLMSGLLDDDDENYGAAFLAYQAKRLSTEITAFMDPREAVRMAMRPMATINLMEDYMKLAEASLYTAQYETGLYLDEEKVSKGALYQRRSGAYEKGDYKLGARLNKVMPLFRTWKTVPWAEGSAKAVQDKLRWFS